MSTTEAVELAWAGWWARPQTPETDAALDRVLNALAAAQEDETRRAILGSLLDGARAEATAQSSPLVLVSVHDLGPGPARWLEELARGDDATLLVWLVSDLGAGVVDYPGGVVALEPHREQPRLLDSAPGRAWLCERFEVVHGRVPSAEDLDRALVVLAARARRERLQTPRRRR